jgi:light-independent protochlorophyllide reductase subunit B
MPDAAPVDPVARPVSAATGEAAEDAPAGAPRWTDEAERELKKIPFFVRPRARRNTETFARDSGIAHITVETLYDAKAHYGR